MAKADELKAGYVLLKDLLDSSAGTDACTAEGMPAGFESRREWNTTKRGARALLRLMRQRISRRRPK